MTLPLILIVLVLVVALAVLAWVHLSYRQRRPSRPTSTSGGRRRILFPFVAYALSQQALDAALRLCAAEDATLVPVFLARVSLHLPLDTPLPRQSAIAIQLQEAIEHRATKFGIPVDARIERGRTYRHALRLTIDRERFDRIVIAAAHANGRGVAAEDVSWLLDNAPGEVLVLRPGVDRYVTPLGSAPAPEPATSLLSVG